MSTNKPNIGAVVLEIAQWILRKYCPISILYTKTLASLLLLRECNKVPPSYNYVEKVDFYTLRLRPPMG